MSGLGSRYAKALISILGDMSPDDILPQLEACRDALSENVDLRRAFESPAITPQEKDGMLSALGRDGKLDEIVVRFLSLLVRQRRLKNLPEMVDAFREIRDERLDVSRVTVRSARPLNPDLLQKIKARLAKVFGGDVEVEADVSPDLLGGIQIQLGSTVFDGSVAGTLGALSRAIVKG